ncbi:MAG: GNAT family N-acetyltransferase [Chloroflexi bacterium]|nr:GNAT family N-acetyltransferase [Chloroflexota bacterium]
MKQLRRLDAVPKDPYRRALKSSLRFISISEEAFRALERERPSRIIIEGDSILIGQAHPGVVSLEYGFRDSDAFVAHFPGMLRRLLPAIDAESAPMGLRLRLTDAPSRPFIEPALSAQAFDLTRDWLRMTLAKLPSGGPRTDEIAPGFALRPARADDAEEIAKLDAAAFAMSWLTADVVRKGIDQEPVFRMLEDSASGRAVGFLSLRVERPGEGYVSDIVLHPDYQRRGLGEAMMRWALAWFRQEGLESAALTVNTDNGPAIALYRKLGFEPTEKGLDYRRPLDEDEVRQVLEKRLTTHIRMRGRY